MAEKITTVEPTVKSIHRNARKKYSVEEKIHIVLEGFRGDLSIAELCRREGIIPNSSYKWSTLLLKAGQHRLSGNAQRQATSDEVKNLRKELDQLKLLVAELSLKNRTLKKLAGLGGRNADCVIRRTP